MRELKERMSNRNQHKSEQEMEKYESEKGGRMRAAFFQELCVIAVRSVMPEYITFSMLDLGVFPLMGFLPSKKTVSYRGIVLCCLSHAQRGLRIQSVSCCF